MKPKLTDAVLRGLFECVGRAEAEMEGVMSGPDAHENRDEAEDVARASEWVGRMIHHRAATKGVRFQDIIARNGKP